MLQNASFQYFLFKNGSKKNLIVKNRSVGKVLYLPGEGEKNTVVTNQVLHKEKYILSVDEIRDLEKAWKIAQASFSTKKLAQQMRKSVNIQIRDKTA